MPSWRLRDDRMATIRRLRRREKFIGIRPWTSTSGTNSTNVVGLHHLHPLWQLFPTQINLTAAGDELSFGSGRRWAVAELFEACN
jgi:hypothetical protein